MVKPRKRLKQHTLSHSKPIHLLSKKHKNKIMSYIELNLCACPLLSRYNRGVGWVRTCANIYQTWGAIWRFNYENIFSRIWSQVFLPSQYLHPFSIILLFFLLHLLSKFDLNQNPFIVVIRQVNFWKTSLSFKPLHESRFRKRKKNTSLSFSCQRFFRLQKRKGTLYFIFNL